MSEFIHKTWFFIVSVVVTLLLSLGLWSLLHGGQPFVSSQTQGSPMRQMRDINNEMQRNFSGDRAIGSGSIGRQRFNENMTGDVSTPPNMMN